MKSFNSDQLDRSLLYGSCLKSASTTDLISWIPRSYYVHGRPTANNDEQRKTNKLLTCVYLCTVRLPTCIILLSSWINQRIKYWIDKPVSKSPIVNVKEILLAFIVLIFPWKETPDRDFTAWRFHKYPDEHSVAGPWILCDNKLIYASVYATGKVRRHV